MRAQHDGLDSLAQSWQPGDVIVQVHAISLPADLPPGDYLLRLGLYNRDTLVTYHLADGRDALTVSTIRVCAP